MRIVTLLLSGSLLVGCDPPDDGVDAPTRAPDASDSQPPDDDATSAPDDSGVVDAALRDAVRDSSDEAPDRAIDVVASDVAPVDVAPVDVALEAETLDAAPPSPDVTESVRDASDLSTVGTLRLIAPISTSVVTSHRPTLRWGPMPEGAAARVTLCDDPACSRVLATLDAARASVRPADALRPGPVFWSVRVTPATGAPWQSPVWEFFVTAHDSPVDGSRCCVVDVNLDGVPDIADARLNGVPAATWSTGVHLSTAGGYAEAPWTPPAFVPSPERQYGSVFGVVFVGDINGDGFGDLGVDELYQVPRIDGNEFHEHSFTVFAGGFSDLHALRGRRILASWPWFEADRAVIAASAAGDIDGDGFGDVGDSVSNLYERTFESEAYPGGFDGLGSPLSGVATGRPYDCTRGQIGAAAFGFDADGDGRCDVATLISPELFVVLRVDTASRATEWRWADDSFACRVGFSVPNGLDRLGDLDGDGYDDIGVRFGASSLTELTVAVVLRGGPHGYSSERTLPIDARTLPEGEGGPLFDANGDGITDRIVAPWREPAALYLGGETGFSRAADLPHCATPCGSIRYFSAGDFNRDGYSDLYAWNADTSVLEIYPGGASGFGEAPVYTGPLHP